MNEPLNLLVLEDSEADFLLIERSLKEHGMIARCRRVDHLAGLKDALDAESWDAVLADYHVPKLDFRESFQLIRTRLPELPVILVSGTIGEEKAVELFREGAWGFVLKDNLSRLAATVEHGLREAAERRARRAVDEELRCSKEMLQLIMDNMPAAVFWKDRELRYLGCNKLFADSAGVGTPAAILERTDYELAWRASAEAYRADDRQVMESKIPYLNYEEPQIRPDGTIFWLKSSKAPLIDGDGKVFGVVGVYMDITELKQAEAKLRLQGTALEAAANEVIITDRKGTIQWVNPAFTKASGYTFKEAVGQNPRVLKSGQHDRAFYENLWATVLRGEVWQGEIINRKKDGSLFTEETTITPVKNERGEITHFIAIKQDITERKKLEAQFLRAQRMESIGTLAGGIAHDLNNILAPIMMSAPLLRNKLTDEQLEGIISGIETSTERGAQIVKQVLTFGRGLGGEKHPLQLSAVINEMVKIMRETFPRNIAIESERDSELWSVIGDATQLHQVLLNLCVNARDAMPDGGKLRLHAANLEVDAHYASMVPEATPGPHVLLKVSDTGTGIPAAIIERIFDPFFTTKGVGSGTGLGLSTVHGIVKGHGGVIQVKSEPGKGTRFSIYLPASPDQHTEPVATPTKPPAGHGELVLVVDDEPAIASAVRRVLDTHGYRVLLAADGTEALGLFAQHADQVALVLTDIMMPLMDGVTLIRALRKMKPGLPMIASTGLGESVRLAELKTLGIDTVLHKPYHAAMLLQTVHDALHPAGDCVSA